MLDAALSCHLLNRSIAERMPYRGTSASYYLIILIMSTIHIQLSRCALSPSSFAHIGRLATLSATNALVCHGRPIRFAGTSLRFVPGACHGFSHRKSRLGVLDTHEQWRLLVGILDKTRQIFNGFSRNCKRQCNWIWKQH